MTYLSMAIKNYLVFLKSDYDMKMAYALLVWLILLSNVTLLKNLETISFKV